MITVIVAASVIFCVDASAEMRSIAQGPVRAQSAQQNQRLTRPNQEISAAQGMLRDSTGHPVGGAQITLRMQGGKVFQTTSTGDGIFRFTNLPPGKYRLTITKDGFRTISQNDLSVAAAEVVTMELRMEALASPAMIQRPPQESGTQPVAPAPLTLPLPSYHQIQKPTPRSVAPAPPLPSYDEVFEPKPNRWDIAMPDWKRYGHGGEYPYVKGRWWDPFNRNKWKGDYPIIGNSTFFSFTGTSDSFFDERRVPAPSGVSQARPGTAEFFGKGEQSFLNQNFRLTFDLFHGDTSFKPVDWRIRFTPEFNFNYLDTQELGLVNINVRAGTNRLDAHAGVQEAFVEYKIAD
ncbi:MAG: carboxypeptidase-like regulatory domain-containing protein, partial [Candidatus Acidiferrales bacterium]